MSKYRTVRRVILVPCPQCGGRGSVPTNHGYIPCPNPDCFGGDVERIVNDIVHDDERVTTA